MQGSYPLPLWVGRLLHVGLTLAPGVARAIVASLNSLIDPQNGAGSSTLILGLSLAVNQLIALGKADML